MRFGVIVSSWYYFANPFKLQPIYELYYATIAQKHLDQNGSVVVYDLRQWRLMSDLPFEAYLNRFVGEQDVYFYWVMKTADYPEVEQTVSFLRKKYPKAKHVAGGTHVELFSNECANVFDTVISGPGDVIIQNVIDDYRDGQLLRRYLDDWNVRTYADSPFPLRDFLPVSSVVNTELFEKYGGVIGTSAMLQRGCCFRCAYCAYNVPHLIQSRTPSQVIDEVSYLKEKYGIKGLNLRDEIAIPLKPETAQSHLNAIKKCEVIWRGQTKVGSTRSKMVTREIIKLASDSGCVELAIGVESASQQVMDIVDKRQSIEQVKIFIRECHKCDIKIKMCLILGLPGEPENIVELTKAFIEETRPDYVNVSGFCPMPGSPIFNDPSKYGIEKLSRNWKEYAHLMYRFSDKDSFGLPFEYKKNTPWGRGFSKSEIIENIQQIQHYLRENMMCY